MSIAPISNENIKVGYISEDDGYVKGRSVAQANAYEALNPGTTYIFLNGDNKVKYLTIDQVNALTSKDLLRSDPCKVGPQPCPPPTLRFYGGGGIIPYEYKEKNFVNALQWTIGLELFLLIKDPWRVFLTTDHPNGAPFTSYTELIRLLMDQDFRNSADIGEPLTYSTPEHEVSKLFKNIGEKIKQSFL